MKKLIVILALSVLMTGLTACGGDTSVDRAEKTLESAQQAVGDAIDQKASQMADAAVGDREIPENFGEIDIPEEITD